MSDAQDPWDVCAGLLRAQVTDLVWHTAFAPARTVSYDGKTLVLGTSDAVAKDRIEGRYRALVQDALAEAGAPNVEIQVKLEKDDQSSASPWYTDPDTVADVAAHASNSRPGQPIETTTASDHQQLFATSSFDQQPANRQAGTMPNGEGGDHSHDPTTLNPRYTFDNFVSGASNRFAHAAAQAAAEMPGRKFNPLFIYGDAGLGKTHLLQAIASYVNDNYGTMTVRYVTSETFLNEFIDSMHSDSRDAFKRRYRDIDVLLVDDVQFFEGKQETVEEFFHTFNHLHQSSRQIVLSSDRPPDQIGIEDRLRSRFKQGLMTDIQPPELETRLAILRKKAELEAAYIPGDVLEFIAAHITDNIRVLEGALIRVSAYASLTHEPLTVERASDVLGDVMAQNQPRPITPQLILEETGALFGFEIEEIISKHRQRPLVTARQISMYVMRELTQLSYPNIARIFGGRDHTTVIHAVEKIGSVMSKDRQIYDQVTLLMQRVRQG